MYKWFVGLTALYLVGDPGLVYLGSLKETAVALVLSLAFMPWIAAHFDN